jgi:serpin B
MSYFNQFVLAATLCFSSFCVADETTLNQVPGNNTFAIDLYQQLKESKQNNLFVSPYSISSAMAMTSMGASGETKNEIDKVLHFNRDPSALATSFSVLNDQIITAKDKPEAFPLVTLANGMWMQVERPFMPEFVDTLDHYFKSGIYALNFAENPEPSRQEINQWVEDRTNRKITDLFPAGSITDKTHLVIASAIYMQAPWKIPFEKENTTHEMFFYDEVMSLVEMMNTTSAFRFMKNDAFALLEMPYGLEKGGKAELAMLVFLPNDMNGLAKLEQGLSADKLKNWMDQMDYTDVQVRFPKFKLSYDASLKAVLSEMGMPLAFTDGADFSGISGARDLAIDDVVHKAYIDIDEKGTEAAAATGVVVSLTSLVEESDVPPYYFLADHPFLFMIVDKTTDSILFMGRYADPS